MKWKVPFTLCVVIASLVLTEASTRLARSATGKKARKGGSPGCKYFRKISDISECDLATQRITVTVHLKKGVNCPAVRQYTRPCSQADEASAETANSVKGCKYDRKAPWTDCGNGAMSKMKVMSLKPGQPASCPATRTKTVPCKKRKNKTGKPGKAGKPGKGKKKKGCKYQKSAWSECDTTTNTRTRQLTLKKGDPATCLPKNTITKKCRKPCKFSKGQWSECDHSTGVRTRIDHFVKGDPTKCEATRQISRKCEKGEDCKYETGDWGECDPATKKRFRTKTLMSGDPEKCKPSIQVSRPCLKPNGEESCFLGSWGEYGTCQNGVMMKHRPVIAGGVQCERKAVKTKSCS